jgi:hypothetical protein
MSHLRQRRRQLLHAFRHPDQGKHGIAERRGFDQAFEFRDQLWIVLGNRPAPATGAANLSLRQRFRVEIIPAANDRRTGQAGDLERVGPPLATKPPSAPISAAAG